MTHTKNKTKKLYTVILAILFSLCLMACATFIMPLCVSAVKYTIHDNTVAAFYTGDDPAPTQYTSLEECAKIGLDYGRRIEEDVKIVIYKDIALSDSVNLGDINKYGRIVNCVFDLNGHTISCPYSIFDVFDINLTIIDSSGGNGTMRISSESGADLLYISDGSVTIEGGTFQGHGGVASVSGGLLTINDGNFYGRSEHFNGLNLFYISDVNDTYGAIKINGGNFITGNEISFASNDARITICGGNFEKGLQVYKTEAASESPYADINDLLADGYNFIDTDGNEIVIPDGTTSYGSPLAVKPGIIGIKEDLPNLAELVAGQSLELSIGIQSSENNTNAITYKWYKDGVLIDGETGDTLTLDGNQAGGFKISCTATSGGVTVSSNTCTVKKRLCADDFIITYPEDMMFSNTEKVIEVVAKDYVGATNITVEFKGDGYIPLPWNQTRQNTYQLMVSVGETDIYTECYRLVIDTFEITPCIHTFDEGVCTHCGYVCTHENYTYVKTATEHVAYCDDCTLEVENSRSAHTADEDNDCTTEAVCICGHVVAEAKQHNITYIAGETVHTEKCTNDNCNYAPETSHTFDKEVTTTQYHAKDASCTQPKTYYKSCICGAAGSETFSVGASLGHDFEGGTWLYTSEAGHYKRCKSCNETDTANLFPHEFDNNCDKICDACLYTRSITHDYTKKESDNLQHWIVCSVCGDVKTDSYEDHTFDNACDTDCNGCDYTRKITHSYTILDSNESDHWYKCSICSAEQPDSRAPHSGGVATCYKLAICMLCDYHYGEIDTSNHDFPDTITYDDDFHYYLCSRCGEQRELEYHEYIYVQTENDSHVARCSCGKEINPGACGGGTRTCTSRSICDVCEKPYGELAPNNHVNPEPSYFPDAGGTHILKYFCCNTVIATGECSGGNATCQEQAQCTNCSAPYGELGEHVGGNADCTTKAACTYCGEGYGAFDPDKHSEDPAWIVQKDGHTQKCNACGKTESMAAHEYSGGVCKVCQHEKPKTWIPVVVISACALAAGAAAALYFLVFKKKKA